MNYTNEQWIEINDNILDNICSGYFVSNYGKIISKRKNKTLGNFDNRYKRFKCTLTKRDGSMYYKIDIATIIYCVFNKIKFEPCIRVLFKDSNPQNMNIDNLYEPNINAEITTNDNYIINSIISSSNFRNNDKIMCYWVNEKWIDITDNEISNILQNTYMVSDKGRVYNKQTGLILHPIIGYNGYISYIIKLSTGKYFNMLIHRIMMKCFCPIKDSNLFEVNHKDNNSFNNDLSNLEWVTSYQNEFLRIKDNKKFERFTDDEVIAICEALKSNLTYNEIAFYVLHKPYIGSLHSRISDIYRKKTYREITTRYNF